MDKKTAARLDQAFGTRLRMSLTQFSALTGFDRQSLLRLIEAGTLKAICTGKHLFITRPMAVSFLTNGGGVLETTTYPHALPASKLDVLKYRRHLRAKRFPNSTRNREKSGTKSGNNSGNKETR